MTWALKSMPTRGEEGQPLPQGRTAVEADFIPQLCGFIPGIDVSGPCVISLSSALIPLPSLFCHICLTATKCRQGLRQVAREQPPELYHLSRPVSAPAQHTDGSFPIQLKGLIEVLPVSAKPIDPTGKDAVEKS